MASVTFDRATRCFPRMDRPAVCDLELEIADGAPDRDGADPELANEVGLAGNARSGPVDALDDAAAQLLGHL